MFFRIAFIVSMIGAANTTGVPAVAAIAFGVIGMVAAIKFAVDMAKS